MVRRMIALLVVGVTTLAFAGARADAPVPEIGVLNPDVAKVISGKCFAESAFDAPLGVDEEAGIEFPSYVQARPDFYKNNCVRLKVVFGPILMKPGQNDVLIQPVTFEKPMYDGYLVRFKPDMVGALAGFNSPRVKDAHLHHGTWLNPGYFGSPDEYLEVGGQQVPNPGRTYGSGPWIATGEEKTIALWPEGYGLKIKQSDAWLFLHMIHNATAQADVVYVTYDLDYFPAAAAEAINPDTGRPNLINTQGRWLDVGDCSFDNGFPNGTPQEKTCQKDSFNPIFNAHRGFNAAWDASLHRLDNACVFPNENCAMFNTLAERSAQQGVDVRDEFGPITDTINITSDGTLVMMGGHVHNGGLADNVYLVRNGEERLIHISDAYYFDHGLNWNTPGLDDALRNVSTTTKIGAPPVSWDFGMTGVTKDLGWSIQVKEGDKLRLEGVFDTTIASWYEEMGIVMTWFVPKDEWAGGLATWEGALDPFATDVGINLGVNARATHPGTIAGYNLPGSEFGSCSFGEVVGGQKQLCVRGQITHPRIETSGDHQAPVESPLPISGENRMTNIPIGAFGFGPADNGFIRGTGMIPTVQVGQEVTFWNADTADYMWHTVTRCAAPCTAATTASYPIANGAWDDIVDRATGVTAADTTVTNIRGEQIAIPAGSDVNDILVLAGPDPMDFDSGQIGVGTGANNKLDWAWTPTRTGTFPFYCRIHPPMRGSIRVVAAS